MRETLSKGHVTAQKRDKDGNPIVLANANPILDTREYMFTFDDGDETVLSVNLIAKAMYAQCDPDGNQYILLDSIIDHKRLDSAIRPLDQKVVQPDGRMLNVRYVRTYVRTYVCMYVERLI